MPSIDANGVSLRYQLSGHGPQLLVLLHEMGGCLESWERVLPALHEQFHVLAFDMRGAGMSEKPRGPFSLDDLVADLGGLMDALGLEGQAALAGCAVGSAVALRFAARHPERVSRVLAMAPAAGIAADRCAEALALADRIETEGVRERILLRFDHSYPAARFDTPGQREAVRGRLLAADPYSTAATYRMLCGVDLAGDLGRIVCPVLVLAGLHDGTRPPAMLEPLAHAIAGARIEVVDSGHVMPLLSPHLVAAKIVEFLSAT